MGVGQELLNKYKNDVANADIGVTLFKREEKVMTKSEQFTALLADMTEEECRELSRLLTERADNMRDEEIEKAKKKFIEAYKEFRQLAPIEHLYVDIDDDDGEFWSEIDLYEHLDNYLHEI